MNNEYNIQFFDTLEQAFDYQNAHSGALYISGNNSKTQIEYDIAVYIAEATEDEQRRFMVVDSFIQGIIERNCYTLE